MCRKCCPMCLQMSQHSRLLQVQLHPGYLLFRLAFYKQYLILRCVCPYGYELAPDGRHCQDIDECSTEANNCRYDCKNLIGSFVCVCPEGFKKVPGSQDECTDIDECLGDGRTLCGPGGTCFNSPGGYSCLCGQVYFICEANRVVS